MFALLEKTRARSSVSFGVTLVHFTGLSRTISARSGNALQLNLKFVVQSQSAVNATSFKFLTISQR